MIVQAIFILISAYFFYFIYIKKFFVFGFKESFCIGLFFYIYLPLIFFYFYNEFLIQSFPKFPGYKFSDILNIQYMSIFLILSFFIGYKSINRKINIFNFNQNYSNKNIFLTIFFLLYLFIFFQIPHVEIIILIFTLCNILVLRLKLISLTKVLFIFLLCLLFMYLTLSFSSARRHIIVILLISSFFLSIIVKTKIKFYLIFILSLLIGLLFVFKLTFIRSILISNVIGDFNFLPSLKGLIQNYDFIPAFDNLIYIVNLQEYLYGKTIFKIFFSFIPREIWPTKPLDTNLLIVNLRENTFLFVGGTSQSITLLGEVFWNFVYVGTFIIFFICGIFAKNFDLSFKNKLYDSQIILLVSLTYLIFLMWRGSISTTLVIYFLNLFLLFFLLNISKFFLKFKVRIKK